MFLILAVFGLAAIMSGLDEAYKKDERFEASNREEQLKETVAKRRAYLNKLKFELGSRIKCTGCENTNEDYFAESDQGAGWVFCAQCRLTFQPKKLSRKALSQPASIHAKSERPNTEVITKDRELTCVSLKCLKAHRLFEYERSSIGDDWVKCPACGMQFQPSKDHDKSLSTSRRIQW